MKFKIEIDCDTDAFCKSGENHLTAILRDLLTSHSYGGGLSRTLYVDGQQVGYAWYDTDEERVVPDKAPLPATSKVPAPPVGSVAYYGDYILPPYHPLRWIEYLSEPKPSLLVDIRYIYEIENLLATNKDALLERVNREWPYAERRNAMVLTALRPSTNPTADELRAVAAASETEEKR